MAKPKFVLTEDLIKVEPEPVIYNPVPPYKIELKEYDIDRKERISLNIDPDLKKNLHLFCIHNRRKMTEIVEISIKEYLNRNNINT